MRVDGCRRARSRCWPLSPISLSRHLRLPMTVQPQCCHQCRHRGNHSPGQRVRVAVSGVRHRHPHRRHQCRPCELASPTPTQRPAPHSHSRSGNSHPQLAGLPRCRIGNQRDLSADSQPPQRRHRRAHELRRYLHPRIEHLPRGLRRDGGRGRRSGWDRDDSMRSTAVAPITPTATVTAATTIVALRFLVLVPICTL